MFKKNEIDKDKWVKSTALLFYQIFSANYDNEAFLHKILSGGGGNSTLCSTWMNLAEFFIPHRISENAYKLLIEKLADNEKNEIYMKNDKVFISKKIYKKYSYWFFNNAKGAANRLRTGKFFHFDHNPSNKKVLYLLHNNVKENKSDINFFNKFTQYVQSIQTLDLITVFEDDLRTRADRNNKNGPLSATDRDLLLNTKFYTLIEIK